MPLGYIWRGERERERVGRERGGVGGERERDDFNYIYKVFVHSPLSYSK